METSLHATSPNFAAPKRSAQTNHPSAGAARRRFPVLSSSLVAIALAGAIAWFTLGHRHAESTPGAEAAPAPVAVGVQTVASQKLRLWNEFSGRLRPVDFTEIRPQVSGRLTEVRVQDGQSVRQGEVMFVIDPRPYEAAVARAEARISLAKANLQFAAAQQQRNVSLLKGRTIAQQEFDRVESSNNAAAAELKSAEADLITAQVDLDHAFVKAPIAGRIGRAELTLGNLVQTGAGAPLLTSIVSENGIYADFDVDEQTYLNTIRDSPAGNEREKTIPVELVTRSGSSRVYQGFIQNFDNYINPTSGTIRARARFENAEQTLVPGMFVTVRLASSREWDLVTVADRAIGFDQSKKFVFVISPDNKAAYREVDLGSSLGGQRVILKGVAAGERVIVDGTQRVRADSPVAPKEVEPATLAQVTAANGQTR